MRIEPRPGYVFVWHRRAANDVAELDGVLARIDEVLAETGSTALMFDSRESEYRGGDVQDRMWAWIQGHPTVKRIATLVESHRLATSVNMTGLSMRVKIKAFHDALEADDWLVS